MLVHPSLPPLHHLPDSLPLDGAVRIELESGVPIFRASATVQNRILMLLEKQQLEALTELEEQELDAYEEIDDYLSFVNRMIHNLAVAPNSPALNRERILAIRAADYGIGRHPPLDDREES